MAAKVASILAEIGIDSSKFTAGAKGAGSSVSDLIGMVGNLNPALLGLSGALTAVAVYLEGAEKAANESNITMAKQEAILKATGYAANIAGFELQNMASELSRLTGIDDEAITSAQSLMLTFRNIGRDEFPRAVAAAADLQTTFGSLESSTMQLGKALNDPLKGITALAKAGVTFSEEQKKQIQGFVDTNQLAKAQAIILSEVEAQVGGTAKAIEDASDGSNRLKVSSENLSEAIGARLVPYQRAWNNALADFLDAATGSIEASNRLADAQARVYEETGRNFEQQQRYAYYTKNSSQDVANLSAEWERAEQYGRAWEATLRAQGIEFEGNTSKIKENTTSIQENEEAIAKANEVTINGAIDITKSNKNYQKSQDDIIETVDKLWAKKAEYYPWETEKIAEVDAKIREQGEKYTENQDKFRAAMEEKFVLMALEKVALSDGVAGYSEAEMQKAEAILKTSGIANEASISQMLGMQLLSKAVADGTITTEQYGKVLKDSLADGVAGLDEIKARMDALKDKTITITTVFASIGRDVTGGGGGGGGKAQKQAVGGPAAGLTWVGEAGPELLSLPTGSFVHNNNTSREMIGGNAKDNSAELIAAFERMANGLRLDERTLAREIVSALASRQ